MKPIVLCISLSYLALVSYSQESSIEKDLHFYADVMVNAFEGENRMRAGQEFHGLFLEYSKGTSLQEWEAKGFAKFISVVKFPEEDRAMVSWHIKGNDEVYDFKGFFYDAGAYSEFNRTEGLDDHLAFASTGSEDWYGAVYTDVMKMENDKYLIFGFDHNGMYDNQKIVDVLDIKEGKILLGAEIFEDKESPGTFLNKIIISYSSDAAVQLNYHPGLEIIINDHLQPRLGLQAGQGATNIPDGTYEGYFLEDGKWMYKEKIFDHMYEEDNPPIPKPVQFNKSK